METPKFEFVNLHGPVQERGAAYRKQVRVGSMRAFRRKERLERAERNQRKNMTGHTSHVDYLQPSSTLFVCPEGVRLHPTVLEATPSFGFPNQEYDEAWYLNSKTSQKDLGRQWTNTDLVSLDPCNMKSIGLNQSQHQLLDHFLSVIAPKPFKFVTKQEQNPIGSSWIRQVLQDRILLEATLFNASVHLDVLHKRQESPITLRQRGEIIRTVNKTLETPERTSDSIIGAIVLMAWSGIYNRDIQEMKIHMNALVQLVRMRGGLENLGFSGILQMLITRLDLITAALTMSTPKFSLLAVKSNSNPITLPIRSSLHTNCKLLELIGPVLDPLPTIFQEIRQLVSMQDDFGAEVPKDSLVFFGNSRSSICHRLLCSTKAACVPSPLQDGDRGHAYLYEPCRVAALIFMEYLFAGHVPKKEILRYFGLQLIMADSEALKAPGVQKSWDEDWVSSKIILWVYFIGSLTLSDVLEVPHFATKISRSMAILGLKSWPELEYCLSELAWTNKMHNEACEELWQEVQQSLARMTVS